MSAVIDNKKIAKNTLYLYLRMIITMGVSLYTSRVVLQVLGIDNFGIYNVVGGVIVLFSFISISLRNCTQRFISYQLGKEDNEGLDKVMSVSLQCHFIFAAIIVVLLLTIGLWFVIEKLNIPDSRQHAALIVYLVSIATFVFSILQTPFQAVIIAHEKMSFYAILSIVEVCLKLIVVYALLLSTGDTLITYSYLILIVTVVLLCVSFYYCYHELGYKKYSLIKDKDLFRQFFSYSGWSMFSSSAYVGAQQGGNILVNIFSNVAANGAFGIANQVSNALYGFVSNFQIAFNPQIVKSFSAGHTAEMYNLINRTSYFGYYIFLIIVIPVLSQIDYLLELWLGYVPLYAPNFCRFLLIYYLVDSIEAPLWMLIGANGKMKWYSIWLGFVTLLNIPISWLLLSAGWSVYWVFVVRVIINVIIAIIRPFHLKKLLPSFSIRGYMKNALLRPLIVTLLLLTVLLFLSHVISSIHPIITLVIILLITSAVIWLIGLKRSDRAVIADLIMKKIRINEYE